MSENKIKNQGISIYDRVTETQDYIPHIIDITYYYVKFKVTCNYCSEFFYL